MTTLLSQITFGNCLCHPAAGAIWLGAALGIVLAVGGLASRAAPNDLPIKPVTQGPYGADLKVCKQEFKTISSSNPKKFAGCHEKLLFAVLPRLRTGQSIPELGLNQSLSPLVLEDCRLEGALTGKLNKLIVSKIIEALSPGSATMRYDAATKKLVMQISLENLPVEGTYDIALNTAKLTSNPQASNSLKSDGSFSGSLVEPRVTFEYKMRERSSRGVTVEQANMELDFATTTLNFVSNKPNDTVATVMNKVVRGPAAKIVLDEILPGLKIFLARITGNIFRLGWRNLEKL